MDVGRSEGRSEVAMVGTEMWSVDDNGSTWMNEEKRDNRGGGKMNRSRETKGVYRTVGLVAVVCCNTNTVNKGEGDPVLGHVSLCINSGMSWWPFHCCVASRNPRLHSVHSRVPNARIAFRPSEHETTGGSHLDQTVYCGQRGTSERIPRAITTCARPHQRITVGDSLLHHLDARRDAMPTSALVLIYTLILTWQTGRGSSPQLRSSHQRGSRRVRGMGSAAPATRERAMASRQQAGTCRYG